MSTFDYFNEKRILITGASSGIGANLAQTLSKQNTKLILTGRNQSALAALADGQPNISYVIGDLLDPSTHTQISDAIQRLGGLDIAILNAGTNWFIEPNQFSPEAVKSLMRQNYDTMVDSIACCLPYLRQTKGQLVMMSSIAGYGGLPRAGAYNASKSALRILAQALDLELRPQGVAVTCVCPGFVKTPLTDKNDFEMPFILHPDQATARILKGISQKKHELHFPWRLSLLLKCVTSLPAAWQYHLLRMAIPTAHP